MEMEVINIPIEQYEEDMDTEISRDKKKEIIELLTYHNHLRSQQELDEIEDFLHEDSSVNTIYSNSFSYSKIKEIYFPNSLKELKEGRCCHTNNLKKIIISPSNDQ